MKYPWNLDAEGRAGTPAHLLTNSTSFVFYQDSGIKLHETRKLTFSYLWFSMSLWLWKKTCEHVVQMNAAVGEAWGCRAPRSPHVPRFRVDFHWAFSPSSRQWPHLAHSVESSSFGTESLLPKEFVLCAVSTDLNPTWTGRGQFCVSLTGTSWVQHYFGGFLWDCFQQGG